MPPFVQLPWVLFAVWVSSCAASVIVKAIPTPRDRKTLLIFYFVPVIGGVYYIAYLLVPFCDTKNLLQFLTDMMIISCLPLFVSRSRNKLPRQLIIPYLLLASLMVWSLTYTSAPLYGLDKTLRFLSITLFALLGPIFIFQETKTVIRFLSTFVLFTLLALMDLLRSGISPGEIKKYIVFGANMLTVQLRAGLGSLFLLFYVIPSAKKNWVKFSSLILLLLLLFQIFLLAERGGVVAFFATILGIFVFSLFNLFKSVIMSPREIRMYFITIFLIILVVSAASFLVRNFANYFPMFFLKMQQLTKLEGTAIEERMNRYVESVRLLLNPSIGITGLGIGGFSKYYRGYDAPRGEYPHNILLEVGVELGIIGLFFFLVLLFMAFHTAILNMSKSPSTEKFLHLMLLALLFYFLLCSLFSGDINDNLFLYAAMGMVYAYRGQSTFPNKN